MGNYSAILLNSSPLNYAATPTIASLTDPNDLALYGSLCAMALARAHAQSGVPGVIAGYLGAGADPNTADAAFADFADAYVRVNRADHQRLLDASAEQWLPSS
nr:DUF2252 family protein [Mycobacteroides chelonae]